MTRMRGSVPCPPSAWITMMAPVKSEIVQAIRMLGACSVAEIADLLDRPADALYRHVDALRKAGLVREAGVRKRGRHAEQLFDTVADDFSADFRGASPAIENRVAHRTASALLKAMGRTVRDAAAAKAIVARPEGRNISMTYEFGRLTPAMYEELRGHLRAIKSLMDRGKLSTEGTPYLSVSVACPVVRKRGSRRSAAARPSTRPRPDA